MTKCFRLISTYILQAFHLFDQDKNGLITTKELVKLIGKVGGTMTEGEARGLIRQVGRAFPHSTREAMEPSSDLEHM